LDDGLILRPSQEAPRAAEFISLSDFPASVVGAGSMGVMHAALDSTTLTICHGASRELGWLAPESVHLALTSPPYWMLKEYPPCEGQLGLVEDYSAFDLVGVVAVRFGPAMC
jgi:hypothetical protein